MGSLIFIRLSSFKKFCHHRIILMKYIFLLFSFCCSMLMHAQTSIPAYKQHLTVAADGTGDYQKIQDAVDAIRLTRPSM